MKTLSRKVVPALISFGLVLFTANVTAEPASHRDLAKEEANRQLVIHFYNQFFNQHKVEQAAKVLAEDYIQHNPDVPDGKAPLLDYFEGYFKTHPQSRADIVRSATDNDLVFLHVYSVENADDLGQAVVDIFRVENGVIVEHWDVIQAVPETSANDNTMF
ncbi:nuclear transport factor 2 family protein [Methylophaga thalassica]|uniref:nuclear transport factor 2 family protein n=1 Tax=Methylophaga aminisulfidivorans TaxID=230105 RepID=UPI0024E26729|nr:nuclear transport factor 2 family protein [Methylophaga aminisulfidivorans]